MFVLSELIRFGLLQVQIFSQGANSEPYVPLTWSTKRDVNQQFF